MRPIEIVLLSTVVVVFALHIKNIIPSWRASRRLEKAIGSNSLDPIVGKKGWQFLIAINPDLILNASDPPEIRALKQEFVDKVKNSRRSHRLVILVALLGLVLGGIVQFLSSLLK
jgi:hypothetical protein